MLVVGDGLNYTFSNISAGHLFTCGVLGNATAACWGSNAAGQLGDASTLNSSYPVLVAGGAHTFLSVSAGNDHACGIMTTGPARCWGAHVCHGIFTNICE